MPNSTRTWQLVSLILACALIAALVQLQQQPTVNAQKGTLPTINNITGYEHLALSPNARRAQERYSL